MQRKTRITGTLYALILHKPIDGWILSLLLLTLPTMINSWCKCTAYYPSKYRGENHQYYDETKQAWNVKYKNKIVVRPRTRATAGKTRNRHGKEVSLKFSFSHCMVVPSSSTSHQLSKVAYCVKGKSYYHIKCPSSVWPPSTQASVILKNGLKKTHSWYQAAPFSMLIWWKPVADLSRDTLRWDLQSYFEYYLYKKAHRGANNTGIS